MNINVLRSFLFLLPLALCWTVVAQDNTLEVEPPSRPKLGPTMSNFDVVFSNDPPPSSPTPSVAPANPSRGSGSEMIDVLDFVEEYIKSGESPSSTVVRRYYSDTVQEYFGQTNVKIEEIIADRSAFLKRWPVRSYSITQSPRVIRKTINGLYVVDVGFSYKVASSDKRSSGEAMTTLKIKPHKTEAESGFRIFSVEETH